APSPRHPGRRPPGDRVAGRGGRLLRRREAAGASRDGPGDGQLGGDVLREPQAPRDRHARRDGRHAGPRRPGEEARLRGRDRPALARRHRSAPRRRGHQEGPHQPERAHRLRRPLRQRRPDRRRRLRQRLGHDDAHGPREVVRERPDQPDARLRVVQRRGGGHARVRPARRVLQGGRQGGPRDARLRHGRHRLARREDRPDQLPVHVARRRGRRVRRPSTARQLRRPEVPQRAEQGRGPRAEHTQLRRGVVGRAGLPDTALGGHAHRRQLPRLPQARRHDGEDRRGRGRPDVLRAGTAQHAPLLVLHRVDARQRAARGARRRDRQRRLDVRRQRLERRGRPDLRRDVGLRRRHHRHRHDRHARVRARGHVHRDRERRRQPVAEGAQHRDRPGAGPRQAVRRRPGRDRPARGAHDAAAYDAEPQDREDEEGHRALPHHARALEEEGRQAPRRASVPQGQDGQAARGRTQARRREAPCRGAQARRRPQAPRPL
ncbi:MAG: hypothetical protein AVDCRST_MAG85-2064, partial [uncultured Solirubrobacteraceae bacterium]